LLIIVNAGGGPSLLATDPWCNGGIVTGSVCAPLFCSSYPINLSDGILMTVKD